MSDKTELPKEWQQEAEKKSKYLEGEKLKLRNGQEIIIVSILSEKVYLVDIFLKNGLLDRKMRMSEKYINKSTNEKNTDNNF